MTPVTSLLPFAAVGAGLAAVVPILLSRSRQNLRETWTFLAAGIQLTAALSMLPAVFAGAVLQSPALPLLPGAPLQFRADPLGLLFLTLASILWTATSAYSVGYLRSLHSPHSTGYFAAFAVAASAAAAIALAANLMTFVIGYEVLTIATWPLVVHRRTRSVLGSGRAYLAYTLLAGQLLLGAVIWAGQIAPGAGFTPGGFLAGTAGDGALRLLFVLFLVGVGAKAAVFPLHGWLPAAMVAPTPVSALLHAVAVVKAGAFGMLRLTGWVFGPELMRDLSLTLPLALLAGGTILFASLRALGEDHLKRRLAYSTVSQLSYIVLGGALGTPLALLGAAFHIAAHGFLKITLFFCAGSVYAATGKERIPELAGLGRVMPITFGAFAVGALGMAGTPLLPGFLGKWNLALGGMEIGWWWPAALLVTSGLLNLGYYLPILRIAFFESPPRGGVGLGGEPTPWLWAPPAFAAVSAVALGIWPDAAVGFFSLAAAAARQVAEAAPEALALGLGGIGGLP